MRIVLDPEIHDFLFSKSFDVYTVGQAFGIGVCVGLWLSLFVIGRRPFWKRLGR